MRHFPFFQIIIKMYLITYGSELGILSVFTNKISNYNNFMLRNFLYRYISIKTNISTVNLFLFHIVPIKMKPLEVWFLLAMCTTPIPVSDCLISSPTYWAQPDIATQMGAGLTKILTKIIIFRQLTQFEIICLKLRPLV